jgi:hypothetical protein
VLLEDKEWDSANERQSTKVTHQDAEGLDFPLVVAISAQSSRDTDGDGVEYCDQC